MVHPYLDIDTKLILGVPPRKISLPPLDTRTRYVYIENKRKLFKFSFVGTEIYYPVHLVGEYFVGVYFYEGYTIDGKHVVCFTDESIPIPVSGSIKIIDEEDT